MYIKSFQLKEIKAFSDVKFDFGKGDQYAGWNVFVGGNASGKSTILKGIALALAGPVEGRVLLPTTQGWLRYSAASGAIDLELVFDKEHDSFKGKGAIPIGPFFAGVQWQKPSKDDQLPIFEANKKSRSPLKIAERSLWNPNASGWFCAGYGPMRRLTGTSADAIRFTLAGGVISRFLTLFREDAALTESEEWLKKEHARSLEQKTNSRSAQLLESVTNFLNDGLLPNNMKISKVTVDQVLLSNQEGLELPMRDLSDGFRSVYALLLDLIHSFAEVYGVEGLFTKNPDSPWQINKPGVVLIDEVEAHLHPVWQQTLPEWLKSRFPLVQFIVTTHSPLIVQAASPGGIYVLPLQNEPQQAARRLDDHEYEKIRLGRAEKILLGEAFGLKQTRSTWAKKQIDQWKRLKAKKEAEVDGSRTSFQRPSGREPRRTEAPVVCPKRQTTGYSPAPIRAKANSEEPNFHPPFLGICTK